MAVAALATAAWFSTSWLPLPTRARRSPTARHCSSATSRSTPKGQRLRCQCATANPPSSQCWPANYPEYYAQECGGSEYADVLAPCLPPDRGPAFELRLETGTHPMPRSRPMKRCGRWSRCRTSSSSSMRHAARASSPSWTLRWPKCSTASSSGRRTSTRHRCASCIRSSAAVPCLSTRPGGPDPLLARRAPARPCSDSLCRCTATSYSSSPDA